MIKIKIPMYLMILREILGTTAINCETGEMVPITYPTLRDTKKLIRSWIDKRSSRIGFNDYYDKYYYRYCIGITGETLRLLLCYMYDSGLKEYNRSHDESFIDYIKRKTKFPIEDIMKEIDVLLNSNYRKFLFSRKSKFSLYVN